ncbi:uncharacterized protein [Danio rerio]|uniref:Uncharacterized protein n=1 Tax=Danio rerio TaxID=7955 RepID=A0AC58IYJ6_DANRE
MSEGSYFKKFTRFNKGIRLVSKPSDLDPYDDGVGVLRAVLSCGHITDPVTLTDCCTAQLKDKNNEFKCPICQKTWPYEEVRKLAKLTLDEQKKFEETLGTNTVKKKFDYRDCPGCGSLIERSDQSNLCVACTVCTSKNRKTFKFCWQCNREWKGPAPRADRCGNVGCKSRDEELLNCPLISLPYFTNSTVQCPKVLKYTSCGTLIKHNSTRSYNMECPECCNEFCFICLKDEHNFYPQCPRTLAPRQTVAVT